MNLEAEAIMPTTLGVQFQLNGNDLIGSIVERNLMTEMMGLKGKAID